MRPDTINVLLVEEDSLDAQTVWEMLAFEETALVRFTWAHTMAAALGVLDRTDADIILADLRPPYSLHLNEIQDLCSRASKLPVVVLTKAEGEAFALEAIRGGAHGYLIKWQVDSGGLVRSLRESIRQKRALTQVKADLEASDAVRVGLQNILEDTDERLRICADLALNMSSRLVDTPLMPEQEKYAGILKGSTDVLQSVSRRLTNSLSEMDWSCRQSSKRANPPVSAFKLRRREGAPARSLAARRLGGLNADGVERKGTHRVPSQLSVGRTFRGALVGSRQGS